MSEEKDPIDSVRAHRELLDELYYVKDVAGEREQQILELKARIDEHEAAIALAHAEIARAHAEMQHILQSRSWRLTAPLRSLATLFGRVNRQPKPTSVISVPNSALPAPTAVLSREPSDEVHRHKGPCLFVDTTELVLRSGQTGVQRVVREVLRELQSDPPESYSVEPIYAASSQPYRYARTLIAEKTGEIRGDAVTNPVAAFRPGDVFLGLDHSMATTIEHAAELEQLRQRGASIYFICYDMLPMLRPDWFPPEVHQLFKRWIEAVVNVGSGVVCISRTVENELESYLENVQISREQPLKLGHFHLGAGSDVCQPVGTAPGSDDLVERLRGKVSFLMVGTIEPRKGHAQALEAFELLWAQEHSVVLVLVGRPGWMTEVTIRRIRHHPEFGKRLFWFMSASDGLLATLYATCTALLAASEGEGFGLPLIEAAQHGLPILCRDLPVFREVAGDNATYFSGCDAESLAKAVLDWVLLKENGAAPASNAMRYLNWKQSTRQLLDVVLGGRWDGSWLPTHRRGDSIAVTH